MGKFFKIFGWVFLGIFLQFKFNILYGIVFLENLNFHDRTYFVKMSMVPASNPLVILHVETTVHHSLGPNYFANVYIPNTFNILNHQPYLAAEPIKGYKAYKVNMKRKYRDVLSNEDFIISPSDTLVKSPLPIIVRFENLRQLLHKDNSYTLSLNDNKAVLTGPDVSETTYTQRIGM